MVAFVGGRRRQGWTAQTRIENTMRHRARILAIPVFTGLAIGTWAGSALGPELLANGDMETWSDRGKLADGWAYSSWIEKLDPAKGEKLEMVADARQAYSGSHCLHAVAVKAHRVHAHKLIAVEPGAEYRLAVRARGKGEIVLGVYECDGHQRFLVTTQDPEPDAVSETWQRYTHTFAPQKAQTARARFFVWVRGDVFLDAASVMPAGEALTEDGGPIDATPLLTIPFMSEAPTLDGRLGPDEWKEAAEVTGFLSLAGRLAAQQTHVFAGFDEECLHFAFVSHSPSGMKAEVREHDGRVFVEDAVEVFLQPQPDEGTYFHLCGNALGTRYEGRGQDQSWNADWRLACHREYDEYLVAATWTAEMSIPFRELGLAGAPTGEVIWRGNFCRDWSKALGGAVADRQEKWTTWAPVGGDFHNSAKFAKFVLRRDAPAIQLANLGDLPRGFVAPSGSVFAAGEDSVRIEWAVVPADDLRRRVAGGSQAVTVEAGRQQPFEVKGELEIASAETWPVVLVTTARRADGDVLLRSVTPYEAIPAFRTELAPLYLEGYLAARFDIRRLADLPAGAEGRLEILTRDGGTVKSATVPDLGTRKTAEMEVDLSDVAPGEYMLKASLLGPGGRAIAAKTQAFPVPRRPEWFRNGLGISDDVPPPFEDVKATGRGFSVWGREHRLGDLPLPEQIKIGGADFLAGPVRLLYADALGRQVWKQVKSKLTQAKAVEARYEFSAATDSARLSGSLCAEYDGFMLYELVLEPAKTDVRIRELRLEIPIRRKHALFMRATTGPAGKWGARRSSIAACIGDVRPRSVPEGYAPSYSPEGWTWGEEFIPQFWVGDDFCGLFCFQESAEHMHWKGSPVTLDERGDVTVVNVHFIGEPTAFDRPLRYRFALQATPLKKRDRRMERMVYGGSSVVTRMKRNQVPPGTIPAVVHWKAGRIEKDYYVTDPEQLCGLSRYTRGHDAELLLNSGEAFFVEPDPDLTLYGADWIQQPPVRYPNHEGTDVTLVKVCPASSFADYYLWWVKKLLDECELGGLYLDLSGCAGCSNAHHGHGYERDDERRMVSDMFATRRLYKRFYTFLKEEGAKRGHELFIFQHSGEGIITPFVDMVTKGEGWVQADTWDTLTPVYFRCCENLLPLGVPYTFYPSVSIPWRRTPVGRNLAPHHDALARTLIHDVFPVGIWSTQVQMELIPLWEAWDEFGVDESEWVPYHARDPRVRTTSKGLLVSFYLNRGRVMAVVANLTNEAVQAELLLDRDALGLPGGQLEVRELRSGKTAALSANKLPLKVEATNLAIVVVN